MKKGDLIFVYGTLRHGERADLSRKASQFGVVYIGIDEINGKMYHMGAFPGVKASAGEFNSDNPTVFGEVFLATDTSIMAVLDAYEGYPNLFNRLQTMTRGGRLVWVYVYPHPTNDEQLIAGGDWCRNRQLNVNQRMM